jgi:hypothetical protein
MKERGCGLQKSHPARKRRAAEISERARLVARKEVVWQVKTGVLPPLKESCQVSKTVEKLAKKKKSY